MSVIGGFLAEQHQTIPVDSSTLALGGVYVIRNTVNGKLYVGSAAWFRRRFKDHRKDFRHEDHHCVPLMRAWRKYGAPAFAFEIVEIVPNPTRETLLEREQVYLDRYQAEWLYNICRIATSQLGMKRSEETRERMKQAAKGRKRPPPFTEEHRRNIGLGHKGKAKTPETLLRMSLAHQGQKPSLKAIEAARQYHLGRPGPKHSEEARRKISIAQQGRTASPETRAKMRAAKLGTKRSVESLRKQSESLKGHVVSEETRAKLRVASLVREERRRQERSKYDQPSNLHQPNEP